MWTKIILLLEGKRVPTYLSSLQWLLSCPAQVTSTQHLSLLYATQASLFLSLSGRNHPLKNSPFSVNL